MRYILPTLLLVLSTCSWAFASDTAPSWVQGIASRPVPTYPQAASVVWLFNEEHMTVDPSGKVTIAYRRALKILNRNGRDQASAAVHYLKGSGKVRELRAWLLAPNGFVKSFGKDASLDVGAVGDELYAEDRVRLIHASDPEIGAVFAYEAELEEKTVFTQEEFLFQQGAPALQSRLILTLPAGWTAASFTYNHDVIKPFVDGSTYTWEATDLANVYEQEDSAPSARGIAPRVVVSFFPPANAPATDSPVFKSWKDVSSWLSSLSAGQDEPSEEISRKAKELTAGASTELDKIRLIGSFVQSLKYVAIQTGEARGGGYRPHPAELVFRKEYGDCKDKANLMRSMLKAVGISSYLITIYSGDRDFVQEDWPSPMQFNHAIIAVHVSDQTAALTVFKHPSLGRLLIFDPTDEHTPVGDLPTYEQGSFALIEAGPDGTLTRMPVTPPGTNRDEVTVDATLGPRGDLQAVLKDQFHGHQAAFFRSEFSHRHPEQFQKDLEQWLAFGAKGLSVSNISAKDDFATDSFHLDLQLTGPTYGQVMQGRLLMFRPSIVTSLHQVQFSKAKRNAPLVLDAQTYRKQVRIALPDAFTVDELPDSGHLTTPFAEYSCSYKVEGKQLVFAEELQVQPQTLPASDYERVKKFFQQVYLAQQAPIVLVRD